MGKELNAVLQPGLARRRARPGGAEGLAVCSKLCCTVLHRQQQERGREDRAEPRAPRKPPAVTEASPQLPPQKRGHPSQEAVGLQMLVEEETGAWALGTTAVTSVQRVWFQLLLLRLCGHPQAAAQPHASSSYRQASQEVTFSQWWSRGPCKMHCMSVWQLFSLDSLFRLVRSAIWS